MRFPPGKGALLAAAAIVWCAGGDAWAQGAARPRAGGQRAQGATGATGAQGTADAGNAGTPGGDGGAGGAAEGEGEAEGEAETEEAGGAEGEQGAAGTTGTTGSSGSGSGSTAGGGGAGGGGAGGGGGGAGGGGAGGGGDDEEAPTLPSEPTLPALTEEQQRIVRPAQGELPERDDSGAHRFFFPPYLREWGRRHSTTVFFPFYFNVQREQDRSLLIPPYFQLRTPRVTGDVLFPIYWRYRGNEADGGRWATDIVPPFYFHQSRGPERAHGMSVGLAPLFFYNETFGRNGRLQAEHLIMPPLLTFHQWWPTGQTTIAGPVFYARNRSTVSWGALPFVFGHSSTTETWTVIPPLLTYRRMDHENNRTFTLVGPYFSTVTPTSASYNLAPLFFHHHDRTSSRTTIVPLFHTSSGANHFTLITPLFGYARDGGETTVVTPLYQNHRGATQMDAIAPLFFSFRDPRRGAYTTSALLLFYHSQSPTGHSWALAPFAGQWHEYGRYNTIATPLVVHSNVMATRSRYTWVFPTVHAESTPDYSVLNIYPLLYTARGRDWYHSVFFPLFGTAGNTTTGTYTTVTPLFGRHATRTGMMQWVFPFHLYWDSDRGGEHSYGWDFNLLFQYGRPRPADEYWSVLHGLVGYRRQGSYQQLRVFYIPFTISGTPPRSDPTPAVSAPPEGATPPSQTSRREDVRLFL